MTIQKALNVVIDTLDLAGFGVSIQVGDRTYSAANFVTRPQTGKGRITIQGNATTPANVLISVTAGDCFAVSRAGGSVTIKDMELRCGQYV